MYDLMKLQFQSSEKWGDDGLLHYNSHIHTCMNDHCICRKCRLKLSCVTYTKASNCFCGKTDQQRLHTHRQRRRDTNGAKG